MEPGKLSKEQIERLLEGKSSRKEAAEILALPDEVFDQYFNEREWDKMQPGVLPGKWSVLWLNGINAQKGSIVRKLYPRYWMSAVAILLLIIGIALFRGSHKEPIKAIAKNLSVEKTSVAISKEIVNDARTVEKYTLPDHSVVELAPGSTVRYTEPMGTDKRSLWLEGEATFHVFKDLQRPFTVYSDALVTTALGTVFMVSSFKNQQGARVRLISGKISVRNIRDSVIVLYLSAGQQCSFNFTTQKLEMLPVVKIAGEPASANKRPALVSEVSDEINFINTPLPKVLKQISTQYKTPILFSSESLKTRKFTGSFKKNEKLESVLEVVLLLNDLQSRRSRDTIYVIPK